jgi:hypothetical protein
MTSGDSTKPDAQSNEPRTFTTSVMVKRPEPTLRSHEQVESESSGFTNFS